MRDYPDKEILIGMDKESQRDFISQMKDEDLKNLIAKNKENMEELGIQINKLLERIQNIEDKQINKIQEEIVEVVETSDYEDLFKTFYGKESKRTITNDEKNFLQEKLWKTVENLKIKIEESRSLDGLIKKALEQKKEPKTWRKRKWFKMTLMALLILTGSVYGISKTESVQEAWATLTEEWFEALTEQISNKIEQEEISEKTFFVGGDSLQNIVPDITTQISSNIAIANDWEKPEIAWSDFIIKTIGDTIQDGEDKNRFYTPCIINLNNEGRFDYRNRGDINNITNTDGAMISTFKPFVPVSDYMSELSKDKDKSTVIAFNTQTGKVDVWLFDDFKDDDAFVVSETWQAKKILKINVWSNNGYLQNIYQKWLILVDTDWNYIDFPIGIGKGESGDELWWYSWGKILIATPDNKHSWFIYGTANQLKTQLEEFKKIYQAKYVLRYDLDQKAYAQTYQTRNKIIYGWQLQALDNLNSAASGSGNILYLKTGSWLQV